MKKATLPFGLLLALSICASVARSQTVQVLDTLYNADGTTASGRLVISWEPFTAPDLTTVDGGTLTYTIPATGGSAGVVNVSLYANAGASPAGTSYRAQYFLVNGAQYTETWVVPASGPVTIADVRVLNQPTTGAAIPISTLTGGPLPAALGGTGLDALGAANLCLKVNSAGTALEYGNCAAGGTGITSLNGEVGASQTFATGTGGNDFNISSASDVHTFNLPSASATNRGALTSADWTAFNSKQPALSTSSPVANQFVTGFTAPGTFTRAQPDFADLAGAATDAQIPDTITVNLAAAATALAANGANCAAGNYPLGVDASGAAENCTPVGGGHTIQDEGTPLSARSGLNFVGPAIAATDDAGNDRTNVTVTINDSTIPDDITLTNITQVTNRAISDTTGDLAASRVDDGGAAATQALFSGGAGAAGFRAIAAGDVPNLEALNGTLDVASGGTGAAPSSDDQVLVASSTSAAAWKSIPDCNTENMLTYTAATNTFGCEADDGGGMTSFNIDGDNSTPQTITNGNTALFVGGAGISTTAAATDQVTFDLDLSKLVSNQTLWNSSQASRTLTAGLSGATDPVLTFADNSVSLNVPLTASLVGDVTGNADTATALAANGANCPAGQAAGGVTAAGAAESCIDPIVSTEIDTVGELAGILTDEDFTPGNTSSAEGALSLQNLQGAVTTSQLPSSITRQVISKTFFVTDGLADTDDVPSIWRAPTAVTIVEVWCESDGGNAVINLQRDDGSPANILSSNLTCTTGGATGTIDTNEDNVADGDRIDFVMVTANTNNRVSLMIEYTVD